MSEYNLFKHQSNHEVSLSQLVGDASPIVDERIPPGYSLFKRDVRLLNGREEPAFYSTREGQAVDPLAWEQSSGSIIEGFAWALTVSEFVDHETEDDDRTQEIGNMIGYALTCGLTEEQVFQCYEIAFNSVRDTPITSEPDQEALSSEDETLRFALKLRDLLPGVEFSETPELLEARIAVLEALRREESGSPVTLLAWQEYGSICEEIVDRSEATDPRSRAEMLIAMIIHKALIFYMNGDIERYIEELDDATIFAYARSHQGYFDEIAFTLQEEIDALTGKD